MSSKINKIRREIRLQQDKTKAAILMRFFKTGKGEYGEGDKFLGIMVPTQRKIAGQYQYLSLADTLLLLKSRYHEERLTALLILVDKFRQGDEDVRRQIYKLYLANTKYINNWDLVDLTASYIVGDFLYDKEKSSLTELAQSKMLFERRIAVIATLAFIVRGEHRETFRISDILLHDKHDLIHKAVGWMLRETGKRCSMEILEKFLRNRYKKMPRKMLRYAIEKFPEPKRKKYLAGQI